MSNPKQFKTFKELGLIFSEGSGCISCRDMSCHNNVTSTINNREYNVHISMNPGKTDFKVHATETSSISSDSDIEANFKTESEAVAFVCKNFNWFKCF